MPKHIARDGENLLFRSMGKSLRITAMFDNDAEANAYMARNSEAAVIAVFGPFVLLADKHDTGTKE